MLTANADLPTSWQAPMNLIFIRTPNQTDGETFDDSKLTINQKAQNTMIKAYNHSTNKRDLSSARIERFKSSQRTALTIRILVDSKNLKGSTLVTGFHGVGQTGYIATSYMIHALKANRIGFVDVSNPPPWVGTAEGGLVTTFEVYRKNKVVLIKLEFSPHRSEEAEFAKALSDWAVDHKFKDAILIGGLDSAFKQNKDDFCVVPTGAYLDRAKIFKAPILEPGLLVYGPLAVMLSQFEIHDFPAVAVLPYAEPARADPAAAALAIRKISKAYNFKVNLKELLKDAKLIEREYDHKSRLTKSHQRLYA